MGQAESREDEELSLRDPSFEEDTGTGDGDEPIKVNRLLTREVDHIVLRSSRMKSSVCLVLLSAGREDIWRYRSLFIPHQRRL